MNRHKLLYWPGLRTQTAGDVVGGDKSVEQRCPSETNTSNAHMSEASLNLRWILDATETQGVRPREGGARLRGTRASVSHLRLIRRVALYRRACGHL